MYGNSNILISLIIMPKPNLPFPYGNIKLLICILLLKSQLSSAFVKDDELGSDLDDGGKDRRLLTQARDKLTNNHLILMIMIL
jgi:hypothetical protein